MGMVMCQEWMGANERFETAYWRMFKLSAQLSDSM
jgi:hypothetical protein